MPLTSILVATDLSPRSDRAMRRAVRLAQGQGAALTFLSVIDEDWPETMVYEAAAQARKHLAAFVEAEAAGVTVATEVMSDDPVRGILAAVDRIAPDLLVLGIHRERNFLAEMRETTAERLVRQAAPAVLIARQPAATGYETVLAPTDFSPASTTAVLLARGLAPDARILPLHAVHVPYPGRLSVSGRGARDLSANFLSAAREDAMRWHATLPAEARIDPVVVLEGPALDVVADVARDSGATLIAAGAHGRAGQAPALLGSLANDLIRQATCDLLLARP